MSDGSRTPPPPAEPSSGIRKHNPPHWAGQPKSEYSLEVIKDGVTIQNLPINDRDHFIVGRQPDVCDILLDHPSISRQHAAIQFNKQDEMFLCDLGSAHGTFLNKERLQPNVYNKAPVSSVIKFGQSTRIYVVQGPPELAPPEVTSAELEAARLESERRQARKAAERARAEERRRDEADGCMWGFAEDAFDDGEDDGGLLGSATGGDVEPDSYANARVRDIAGEEFEQEGRMVKAKPKTLVELTREAAQATGKVHEADQQLFERMMKRRAKIENLRNEIARIKSKEGADGLSEGQQHHIRKTEERIEQLEEQVEENEETLRLRNTQRQVSSSKRGKKRSEDDELNSSEDEFFDRTLVNKKRQRGTAEPEAQVAAAKHTPVETWESLNSKLESVREGIASIEEKIAEQSAAESNASSAPKTDTAGDEDELDVFMKANDILYVSDTVKALQGEVLVLQTEANRLQKLCDLVRPALPGLKPKLSAEVNVTSATSSVTAVDPASPSTSDTGAKPLTGVDKKEAYWKEKLKASKGKAVEKTGKDAATTAAEQAVVTLEEAKPKHVGLGSGPVSGTVTTSATASAKYAVNRLPSSAEVAMAGYKPGLNSMGSKP